MENNFHKIPLNEDVISKLGFGECWGDSGDSSTRYLSDPEDKEKCTMRIHEMHMVEDTSMGYGKPAYAPNCFKTDSFGHMWFLHELIDEAEANFPKALPILKEAIRKHNMEYAMDSYYKAKQENQ